MAVEVNSIDGWTREQLLTFLPDVPWLEEAEAKYGTLQRHCAMNLPDGRQIHVTAFAAGWRWTLMNPANEPPNHEVDIWLSPEGMEASLMLVCLCKSAMGATPETFYAHLEHYVESAHNMKED